MRALPMFGGAAMIILGLLMINFGVYTYKIEVPKFETRVLFDHLKIQQIGDFAVREIEMQSKWSVCLEGEVNIPSSTEKGKISLFVMNNTEYQKWRGGVKDVRYIVKEEGVSNFNVTVNIDRNGFYYILLDNRDDPTYKKDVTLTLRYTFETKVPELREDRTLISIGYPIVILGVIGLVYGLIRKPEVRWE
ncbi:hypothetical protein KEJ51_01610 [Candidatus Bathyarchaeota archaeon]|nr:hypothetical protein [Candidatus Bathyarchaeota archaeon]MBS7628661.1 hypothetical protein [Candidatus Bathyarchaeota archaeon]